MSGLHDKADKPIASLTRPAPSGQLQRRNANAPAATGIPPIVHAVVASPGQPLDQATRAFMEPRFGHDFGQVRVHTDAQAAESAKAVGALAYTTGSHIVFGARQYAPATHDGKQLMAHELAHVVQQSRAATLQRSAIARAGGQLEHEATLAASAVLANQPVPALSTAETLQKQDAGSGSGPDASAPPDAGPASDAGAVPDAGVPGAPPPAPALPAVRLLRVEVHPDHRGHFPSIPSTGAGTHWVGVASATARKPIVRAVVDPEVPASDPSVAGLTWSGPDVTADAANPLQAEVDRMAGERRVTATLAGVSASTTVWAVFARISATAGPAPTFAANATSAQPGGTINLQATIFPNSILTAPDRPALQGPNDTAPPGGTSPATGNPLANGADHHWDFSRKSRDRVVNPSAIPLANFVVPGDAGQATIFASIPWAYPARWEEGNDDSSPADETNNPYAAAMTSGDTPADNLLHSAGADGDTFEDHAQFQEFVRLELNRSWWVISQMFPWRVHMRVRKVAGRWINNGTDVAADNAGF